MTKPFAAGLVLATCLTANAQAATFTFPHFTISGATSVTINAINDSGIVAGTYVTAATPHGTGFTGRRNQIVTIANYLPDGPIPSVPHPSGITNDGTVIGNVYTGLDSYFTWKNGAYTATFGNSTYGLDSFPPMLTTGNHVSYNIYNGHGIFTPYAGVLGTEQQLNIGNNATVASTNRQSEVAGQYTIGVNSKLTSAVFFGTPKKVVPLLPPGATSSAGGWLNDAGQVAGSYTDSTGLLHGFIHAKGVFTTFNMPVKPQTLTVQGIDLSGHVVGAYQDQAGHQHGFYYSHGTTKTLNSFASTDTVAVSISHLGHGIAMSVTAADGTATSYLVHCVTGPGAC